MKSLCCSLVKLANCRSLQFSRGIAFHHLFIALLRKDCLASLFSFSSIRTEPINRIRDVSFGNTPMTLERRLSSLLILSTWLDVRKNRLIPFGNTMTVMATYKPT